VGNAFGLRYDPYLTEQPHDCVTRAEKDVLAAPNDDTQNRRRYRQGAR
jgi:hypothetical protein